MWHHMLKLSNSPALIIVMLSIIQECTWHSSTHSFTTHPPTHLLLTHPLIYYSSTHPFTTHPPTHLLLIHPTIYYSSTHSFTTHTPTHLLLIHRPIYYSFTTHSRSTFSSATGEIHQAPLMRCDILFTPNVACPNWQMTCSSQIL